MTRVTDQPENRARIALADAFMNSLWPSGEQAYLANHTRSFLSGVLGEELPHPNMSGTHVSAVREHLAAKLRRIADGLDLLNQSDEEPF